MTPFLSFLLKANLALIVMYGVYFLCFRRDTFYGYIRWFFLASILASVLFPLINISAWLLRRDLKQNIEYYTDRMTLRLSKFDRKHYQYSLLRVSNSAFQIVNHFHFNNLKKRIIMMNKKESPRIVSAKYLLVIPALAAALLIVQISGLQASKSVTEETPAVVPTATVSPVVKSVESNISAKAPVKKPVKPESIAQDTLALNETILPSKDNKTYLVKTSSGQSVIIIDGANSQRDTDKISIEPSDIAAISIVNDEGEKDLHGGTATGTALIVMKSAANSDSLLQVSGCVTDANNGKPLPGVAIVVKGSVSGTVTNMDGKYSMNVPANAILQFFYINRTAREILVLNRRQIDVTMYEKSADENIADPLYIVDGKAVGNIKNISPKSIESVSVLKGKSATETYGDAGKNGVVLIELKKKAF